MTVEYSGSNIKSFPLSSYYYGYSVAIQQAAVSVAVACNITVIGYAAGSTKSVVA